MGYAQLDNGFWLNEKVDSVSDKAFRLYVRSISFSSANLTDGFISDRNLKLLGGTTKIAEELVKAQAPGGSDFGLWERVEGGYAIHDYAKHNRVQSDRDAATEKATKAASKRWGNATSIASSNATSISTEHATSILPMNAKEKNREEKNREEQEQASLSLADDTLTDPLPVRIRELRDTILLSVPQEKRADPATCGEAEQLARDYEHQPWLITNAITTVRRQARACYPGDIRKVIGPLPPAPKPAFQLAPNMGPDYLREKSS